MQKGLKDKWVAALRSGKYKQITAQLKKSHREATAYCCLGVACEVAEIPQSYPALQRTFNLTKEEVYKFIELNDGKHKSFEEIADYIEENY